MSASREFPRDKSTGPPQVLVSEPNLTCPEESRVNPFQRVYYESVSHFLGYRRNTVRLFGNVITGLVQRSISGLLQWVIPHV